MDRSAVSGALDAPWTETSALLQPVAHGGPERNAAEKTRTRPRRWIRAARGTGRESARQNDSRSRWLVSYADFMTLLFGFFVVMYAVSSVNEEKYRQLSTSLSGIFENSTLTTDPVQVGEPQLAASTDIVDVAETPGYENETKGDTMMRTSREYAESALGGFGAQDGVIIASNEHWLEISLDSEVSFRSGSATLEPKARQFLDRIGDYLGSFPHPVTIEGYTDNVAIQTGPFASNWLLSSARASAVAEYLAARGIDERRLSAVGYGENHALATNATPEGRARNRRVVLVVAHNGNLPRNLNTAPETSAFAFVRHEDDKSAQVPSRRTEGGGLLFTNE